MTHALTSVKFSPSGRLIAVSSLAKTVYHYTADLTTQIWRLRGSKDAVCGVAFALNESLVYGASLNRSAQPWLLTQVMIEDWSALQSCHHFKGCETSRGLRDPTSVTDAFSGLLLKVTSISGSYVVASSKGRKVRIWDTSRDEMCCVLSGWRNSVIGVDTTSSGNLLAVVVGDHRLSIWRSEIQQDSP